MHLYYFFDPMCSWCWGFAPQFSRLHKDYSEQIPISMVVGGLRSESQPMTDEQRATIRGYWQRVQEASGQPFDFENGLPAGFVYDTEPACRAAVVVRELDASRELLFVESMQRAFYQKAQDITDSAVVERLAVEAGVDGARFAEALASDAMRARTRADYELSASLGIQGFPTLALKRDQQWIGISQGYLPWDSLQTRMEAALAQS
ncbi:DsbA family protein [Aestuariirhabdus sp. LZHN29]|uniref:DsbA family protein n=1 Tax=Aestuariirhabdus sp. LZHN29 TaxID=3417462 RepID=UPI003CF7CA9F